MHLVILDGFAFMPPQFSWQRLQSCCQVHFYDHTDASDTVRRCRDAELVLTNKVVLDRSVIAQLPRLRYIGVLATGYNVVDIAAATERGIVVTNIPAYSTDSVTQFTWAHILNILCQVAHYADANAAGQWCRSRNFCWWDTPLTELAGKTLGIIGYGNIGRSVARVAEAFGMQVLALESSRVQEVQEVQEPSEPLRTPQRVPLPELLSQSDIITLHCPLTAENTGLINRSTLALMRPGAILINTGRGGLVVEADVAEALRSGRLRGYGADVLSVEPASASSPLIGAPHCYLTPHIAWATTEARQRLVDIATDNVLSFLHHSTAPNAVNL